MTWLPDYSASLQNRLLDSGFPIVRLYLDQLVAAPRTLLLPSPSLTSTATVAFYENCVQTLVLFVHLLPAHRVHELERFIITYVIEAPVKNEIGVNVLVDAWVLVLAAWRSTASGRSLLKHVTMLVDVVWCEVGMCELSMILLVSNISRHHC